MRMSRCLRLGVCCACEFADVNSNCRKGSCEKLCARGVCDGDVQRFECINHVRFSFAAGKDELSAGMKSIRLGVNIVDHHAIKEGRSEGMTWPAAK